MANSLQLHEMYSFSTSTGCYVTSVVNLLVQYVPSTMH